MSFSNSIKLTGLSTREAIADALYRIMSALDENDAELLQSGMTEGITLNINGLDLVGFAKVKRHSFDTVGPMDTTHFVTSIRIDISDETSTTAKLTANTLAQHYSTGTGTSESERRLLGGSKHRIDLILASDGMWKAKTWQMKRYGGKAMSRFYHHRRNRFHGAVSWLPLLECLQYFA